MAEKWIDVCAEDEIPAGSFKTVWLDEVEVAVFNLNGDYYALEDVCTHDGGELTGGPWDGDVIECPRHGAQFDIRTGEVLAPPAYEPVPTYPVRVANGMIQVQTEDL